MGSADPKKPPGILYHYDNYISKNINIEKGGRNRRTKPAP